MSASAAISSTGQRTEGRASRQNPGPACQQCRLRKYRCDRRKPCGGCVDSALVCAFDTAPPQRGPKKGHLKVLKSRIAALERRMDEQPGEKDDLDYTESITSWAEAQFGPDDQSESQPWDGNTIAVTQNSTSANMAPYPAGPVEPPAPGASVVQQKDGPGNDPEIRVAVPPSSMDCTLIAGPVSHLLPPFNPADTVTTPLARADLDHIYFERVYIFIPFLQKHRYFWESRTEAKLVCPSHPCLQFAMWTLAAAVSSQFQPLSQLLYQETLTRLSHFDDSVPRRKLAQAWILISVYEFTHASFERAWSSLGRAIRLVQLLRFDCLDSGAVEAHADSFIEKEENRRTFWTVFCLDRFSCGLRKLPLTFRELSISTRLPCPEGAFQSGSPVLTPFLSEAAAGDVTVDLLSPFAESVIFTSLWGRISGYQQHSAPSQVHTHSPIHDLQATRQQLDDAVTRRILQFRQTHTTCAIESDPMLSFTSIVAQTALLVLHNGSSSWGFGQLSHSLINDRVECQWQAREAAKEIARLAGNHTNFSVLKIHPFTPIPLYLCRQFLSRLDQEPALQQDLAVVNKLLVELRSVNALCQDGLEMEIDLEMDLADSCSSNTANQTDPIIALFENDIVG
ncbi:fungal-specific transcription factor domain-containing protein [Xylaria venustula]|nr:fungal-specific transcription factor domain-containing protein [Xylaria venustula]